MRKSAIWIMCFAFVFLFVVEGVGAATEDGQGTEEDGVITEIKEKIEQKTRASEEIEEMREEAERREAEERAAERMRQRMDKEVGVEELNLPVDNSQKFEVTMLKIRGNTLVDTAEIIEDIPVVFNESQVPLVEADSGDLYDLRSIQDVVLEPGKVHQVSARTIQGFTKYILSVYTEKDYAGVYVYVPASAVVDGSLKGDVLTINVIEARLSDVEVNSYDFMGNVEGDEVYVNPEGGYLKEKYIQQWNPVKAGTVTNERKLREYVSLLNLNPDRYVSAIVSKGADPNTLSLGFDVYEASPWHFYAQLDNSGTNNRRWNPKFGLIHTNLTGRDDRVEMMWQGPMFTDHVIEPFEDNYSYYISYEAPLWTQRLRLKLYHGRSKFEIGQGDTAGGIASFRGNGEYWGGILRHNIWQWEGDWHLDMLHSLSQEYSRVTTSIGPFDIPSDVEMNLWGIGFELHRTTEMATTSVMLMRYENIGGSNLEAMEAARTGARPRFHYYDVMAMHRMYLDDTKIHQLFGSIRAVVPDRRLVPAKMTTLGGMYTVRGYKEDEFVADQAIILRGEYEYDLIALLDARQEEEVEELATADEIQREDPWLKKFAILLFMDHGRGTIKQPVAGEIETTREMTSIGLGMSFEVTDHFESQITYGWPLRGTEDTDAGHGQWNYNFIARW